MTAGGRARLAQASDRNHGAIAQLGERLICIQEAVGSTPSGSTILSHERKKYSGFRSPLGFRDVCYRKGKTEPAARLVNLKRVLALLLQPIERAWQQVRFKGSVCKKPTMSD